MVKALAVPGATVSGAARAAGYSASTAHSRIYSLLESKPLRKALALRLAREGINDQLLFGQVRAGLQAMQAVACKRLDDPEAPPEVIERPDHRTRHSYVETVCRLKGYLGRESADDRGDVPTANVTIELRLGGAPLPDAPRRTITVGVQAGANSIQPTPRTEHTD